LKWAQTSDGLWPDLIFLPNGFSKSIKQGQLVFHKWGQEERWGFWLGKIQQSTIDPSLNSENGFGVKNPNIVLVVDSRRNYPRKISNFLIKTFPTICFNTPGKSEKSKKFGIYHP